VYVIIVINKKMTIYIRFIERLTENIGSMIWLDASYCDNNAVSVTFKYFRTSQKAFWLEFFFEGISSHEIPTILTDTVNRPSNG